MRHFENRAVAIRTETAHRVLRLLVCDLVACSVPGGFTALISQGRPIIFRIVLSTRLRVYLLVFWFCAEQKERNHDLAKFPSKIKTQRQVKS